MYLFDEISCKMHHDRFYMVLSLLWWILSYSLDCITLTLSLFKSLNCFFSTIILYLVFHQFFIKFSTSKLLCCQKYLLQNQNKIVVMLTLVNKLVYWIMVLSLTFNILSLLTFSFNACFFWHGIFDLQYYQHL